MLWRLVVYVVVVGVGSVLVSRLFGPTLRRLPRGVLVLITVAAGLVALALFAGVL